MATTWRDVRKIARAMPSVTEVRGRDGRLSWKVEDRDFAWDRPLRKSDVASLEKLGQPIPAGEILAIRTSDLEMKEALLLSSPRVCFTIPHFEGYAAVLVLLDNISTKQLEELLVEAWLARASHRSAEDFLANRRPASKKSKPRG